VNHYSISSPLLLWLDPDSPLGVEQAEVLCTAGWQVKTLRSLDELAQLGASAAAVALRLKGDVSLLTLLKETLDRSGISMDMIVRIDRNDFQLGIQAHRHGATWVMGADDWSLASWRQLQETKPEPEAEPLLRPAPKSVVFVDPASQHLLALAKRVAQAEVTALLVGPTGSGKEVLARVLHEYSPRAKGPFVAMNCAAMPDHLIEDMLFGHEKGAFTGAHKDHKGLFEQAQGGTLFLDEIGEMPMHLQSKLLRVLQEKQLTRLGGQQVLHLNVRIIAATNKDLKGAISSKEFREDLYYRIATFRMRLLPLNQRRGDIIPLALQFLSQQAKGHKWQIDEEAQSLLLEYAWPGNVRELENVMRRAMVLCPHQTIGTAHLMFDDWVTDNPVGSNGADSVSPLSEVATTSSAATTVAEAPPSPSVSDLYSATRISEHQVIMATLAETTNREEAAKRLGISPRTLRYKLAQFKAHGLSMAA